MSWHFDMNLKSDKHYSMGSVSCNQEGQRKILKVVDNAIVKPIMVSIDIKKRRSGRVFAGLFIESE